MHRLSLLLFVLVAITASASTSDAQCPLGWRAGDELPGIGGSVNVVAPWDPDGAGPLSEVLIAAGQFQVVGDLITDNIAAWDGKEWSAFGPGVGHSSSGNSVKAILAQEGQIVAGGDFFVSGSTSVLRIARWDGAAWQPLGAGLDDSVRALTVYNGEIIAAGDFISSGNTQLNRIARWNGTSWQPFGTGVDNTVRSLCVFQGELIAGGNFNVAGGASTAKIARWNGSSWQAMGTGMSGGSVFSLALFDNELVAGGGFTTAGGIAANKVARWNGTSWQALGPGPGHSATSLTIWDNKLVASTNLGVSVSTWDGAAWSLLPAGLNGGGDTSLVRSMCSYNGDLFAGGDFISPGRDIARYDGKSWQHLGRGMNNFAYASTLFNGDLYMGGIFNMAGDISATRIVRYDGANYHPLGSGMNSDVYCLLPFRNELHASGYFTNAGDVTVNQIARWDGQTWNSVGGGVSGAFFLGPTAVFSMAEYQGDLIVGGNFTMAGSTPANCIARWDGTQWFPLGSGMAGPNNPPPIVVALTVYNGELIAGGYFTSAGGVPATYVARWNGTSWLALGTGMNGAVWGLGVYNNLLIAVGQFGGVGQGVARWNGSTWAGFNTFCCSQIHAVGNYNGELVIGGVIYINSSSPVASARWPGTGPLIDMGISAGPVWSFTRYRNELIPTGGFWQAGNLVSAYWSRWRPTCPKGDMNCDNVVNQGDTLSFVNTLLSPTSATDCQRYLADMTADGTEDGQDIAPFIAALKM
jgi:hypothetical protein